MELGHTAQNWLILTDYASKYKVSVSTLRRRIKSNTINHKFEGGRYLLADEAPVESHQHASAAQPAVHRPHFAPIASSIPTPPAPPLEAEGKLNDLRSDLRHDGNEEPILSTATRLLNELKRAYSNILQEKEEQMIQLKEEVVDLKTLVRVLESDNDRMRNVLQRWGTT